MPLQYAAATACLMVVGHCCCCCCSLHAPAICCCYGLFDGGGSLLLLLLQPSCPSNMLLLRRVQGGVCALVQLLLFSCTCTCWPRVGCDVTPMARKRKQQFGIMRRVKLDLLVCANAQTCRSNTATFEVCKSNTASLKAAQCKGLKLCRRG
jgi:hypothetical protein